MDGVGETEAPTNPKSPFVWGKATQSPPTTTNTSSDASKTSFGGPPSPPPGAPAVGTTRKIRKRKTQTAKKKADEDSSEIIYTEEVADIEESQFGFDQGIAARIEPALQSILSKIERIEKRQQVQHQQVMKEFASVSDRMHGHHEASGQALSSPSNLLGVADAEMSAQSSRPSSRSERSVSDDKRSKSTFPAKKDGTQTGPDLDSSASEASDKLALIQTRPDNNADAWRHLSWRCYNLVHHEYFEKVMGFIVLLNTLQIGWAIDTAEENGDKDGFHKVFDIAFLVVYSVELCMRFCSDGIRRNLKHNWTRFDICVVCLGALSVCVIEPILDAMKERGTELMRWSRVITVMRVVRLLRLLRSLRLLRTFKTLWKLTTGLIHSLQMMFWTLILILFVLYCFSCVIIEVIARDNDVLADAALKADVIDNYYSGISKTMFALISFVTLENVNDQYYNLCIFKPFFCLIYIPLILIVSMALVNLITAVIVEGAIESARADKELAKEMYAQQVKALMPQIEDAFLLIDTSGDDEADLDEVMDAYDKLPVVIAEQVNPGSLKEVFELLDFNGSGTISKQEFIDGILQLTLSEQPIETKQMLKALQHIRQDVAVISQQVTDMQDQQVKTTTTLGGPVLARAVTKMSNNMLEGKAPIVAVQVVDTTKAAKAAPKKKGQTPDADAPSNNVIEKE